MLHDLRGSLTAVRGWVELLSMDGSELPGGLVRSVEGFAQVVQRYGELTWPGGPRPGQPSLQVLLGEGLGLEVGGLDGAAPVDGLRLAAALELAAPSLVELLVEPHEQEVLSVLRVHGLADQGVSLGITPHHDEVLGRMAAPDPVLGACLLREVARGGRGEVRSRAPGTLDLVCRVP